MRSKTGFSLVEVIIALVVIGIVVTVLLATQAYTVRAATRAKREITVVMALKQRLAEVDLDSFSDKKRPLEEPLPDYCPLGMMTYEARRPQEGSALSKLPGMRIETVRATWHDGTVPITQELVRFVYAPAEAAQQKQ
jgi:prepilin-type N-terminal cleavage/methylation domain-containing protein